MAENEQWVPVNLADMFLHSASLYADREALKYKVGHHYHTLTYGQLRDEVFRLMLALQRLGLKQGDRAVIISENRPEWVISDLAMMGLGIATVPIHEVLSPAQLGGIVSEVGAKAIFFSDHDVEAKLLEVGEIVADVPHLISFEKLPENGMKRISYFKKIIEDEDLDNEMRVRLTGKAKRITSDTLASIIYTSGTSGHFKGVLLTHNNFLQNIEGIKGNIWSYPEDRFFSVLPLSHVFERAAGYYVPICTGSSIGYCLELKNIVQEVQERKPTIILAVPRLFEKIYEGILEKMNHNIVTKLLFKLAMRSKQNGLLGKIMDKIVFSKIRATFGGEVRFFISGGAKLPEKIGKFFHRAGLIILEGYGLTETSPVIAVNKLDKYKFGTVGPILANLKVKISDDDEVLVKGPSVMSGYVREEDTVEAFTKDGYFHTGDLGYFDRDGFLVINGRKKDLLVLTTGKKVAPVQIEEALELSPFIEQTMVFGDGYKHIGALIVPSIEAIGEKLGIEGKAKILKDPRTEELIAAEAKECTKDLSTIERVKKFVILPEPFSIENGEMTPKLSLRRHVILARYRDLIEEIYT